MFERIRKRVLVTGTRIQSLRLPQVLGAVAMLLCWVPIPAMAQYLLDGGDVVEVSVLGKSDLTRRTTVDVDGNIIVPLVGELKAAGLSLTELRNKVGELLSTSDSIRVTDVAVQLVEPRPFYIQGDVSKAGSYSYRPGATVRQALAIAGGLSVVQASNTSPLTLAELRGRYKALKSDLAKNEVKVAGLRSELQNRTDLGVVGLADQSQPGEMTQSLLKKELSELAQIEIERLKSRYEDKQKEVKFLLWSSRLADNQVAALEQGQKQDEEAVMQQSAELDRVAELNRRGMAVSGRVADEQRSLVLLKSREMDTKSRLAAARQARVEKQRQIEKTDERTLGLPQQLQDAIVELGRTKAQLEAVGEQLTLAGESLELLDGEPGRRSPEVVIFRKQGGQVVKIAADEDTEIKPSDVIEVTARSGRTRAVSMN